MKFWPAFALFSRAIPALVSALPSAIGKTDPVCIVGAGPTGLTVAHELEAKGYSTVTFEKEAVVGGKCQAIYEEGPHGCVFSLIQSPVTGHADPAPQY